MLSLLKGLTQFPFLKFVICSTLLNTSGILMVKKGIKLRMMEQPHILTSLNKPLPDHNSQPL
jgi:hypothetical protein